MRNDVESLLERVKKATGPDNALDIEIEIALFEPDAEYASVRSNSAGTKLVYTRHNGKNETFWAFDHTLNTERRQATTELLQSLQERS